MAKTDAAAGLSKAERDAVKERAKELREEAKAGKSREAGEKAVHDAIAGMPDADAAIARRIHEIVADIAPELMPKTWYGMPAYANRAGKVVVYFTAADKFKSRFATFGFDEAANLDDGDMWATSFALLKLSPTVEKKMTELIKKAAS